MAAPKLLLVSPLPPPAGGVETWTAIVLAEMTRQARIQVELLNTVLRFRRQNDNGLYKRLVFGGSQALLDVLHFRRLLERFSPDVVHINSPASLASLKDYLMIRSARRRGARVVLHFHIGFLPVIARQDSLHWRLVRRNMQAASATVLLGRRMVEDLAAIDPALRLHSIPNPVDLGHRSQTATNSDRALKMVYVGKVNRTKGAYDLVEALALLPSEGIDLSCIGSIKPSVVAELRDICGRSGRPAPRFLGEISREATRTAIADADVLVLPSWMEGFPYVILEAMAAGRAVVATNVGAIPEMVAAGTSGECGILVPPRNPAALAAALGRLRSDWSLVQQLGKNGRRRAEAHYSASVVLRTLEKVWFGLD